jgi:hypothetical protein
VLLGVLILVLVAACSGGGDGALTTPTTGAGGGGERGDGVTVQRRGFEAGGDPGRRGAALLADLIARPPRWTIPLDRAGGSSPVNVEGVASGRGGHDLVLLAENRDVFSVPATAYQR